MSDTDYEEDLDLPPVPPMAVSELLWMHLENNMLIPLEKLVAVIEYVDTLLMDIDNCTIDCHMNPRLLRYAEDTVRLARPEAIEETAQNIKLRPKAKEALGRAVEQGKRIVFVSNCYQELQPIVWATLRQHGVDPTGMHMYGIRSDDWTASCRRVDPAFAEVCDPQRIDKARRVQGILGDLNLQPDQCVYVDDNSDNCQAVQNQVRVPAVWYPQE